MANRDVDEAVEHSDRIDVWRVLHGERDIPAWMRGPADLKA
jgi:toxin ParE1/3/4